MPSQYTRSIARLRRLNELSWRRYANPWSVWTRILTMPALLLSAWSFQWIGVWGWIPLIISMLWTVWNPRAFSPAGATNNWASRATLGERVWLNEDGVEIPPHHDIAAKALVALIAIAVGIAIVGIAMASLWITSAGTVAAFVGKILFCDRMVRLYADMIDARPEYREWLK